MQLTVWEIIAVSLIPLALLVQIWVVKNWRRLGDLVGAVIIVSTALIFQILSHAFMDWWFPRL